MGRTAFILLLALVIPLIPLVSFCHHLNGADHVEIVGLCHDVEAASGHVKGSTCKGEEPQCEAPARHEKAPASELLRSPRDGMQAPLGFAPTLPAPSRETALDVPRLLAADALTERARLPLAVPLRL
jgi:hypothetical protein